MLDSLTLDPNRQVYEDGVWKYPLMQTGRPQRPILKADEGSRISLRDLEQPYKSIFYGLLIISAAIAANLYFKGNREEVFDALTKSTIEEKTTEQPSGNLPLRE